MRDQDERHAEPIQKIHQQVHDPGLNDSIERSRRLVGDQQPRAAQQGHGDDDPLAHAAGEFMREHVDAIRRVGNPNGIQHPDGLRDCVPPAHAPVVDENLGQLRRDPHIGVE